MGLGRSREQPSRAAEHSFPVAPGFQSKHLWDYSEKLPFSPFIMGAGLTLRAAS